MQSIEEYVGYRWPEDKRAPLLRQSTFIGPYLDSFEKINSSAFWIVEILCKHLSYWLEHGKLFDPNIFKVKYL